LLAYLALSHMVPAERAVDPNQMYLAAYEYVFADYGWAVAATALFVVVSQLKINVTNAYAGSLAWSNFFSRLTHSHPGRVVWVVFNTLIALMLMELNVFQALGGVLGLYSNIAISWIMAVVADLVINKPLGLSPKGIEFKRAHLYDVNPVGVGAMVAASVLSITAHLGFFGEMAQAFSALIALVTAVVVSPLIAWATKGRYYIARRDSLPPVDPGSDDGYSRLRPVTRCVICEREYERDDMAQCPAYQGAICSLCCTLDARCNDLCKPQARLSSQWSAALRRLLPRRAAPYIQTGLAQYLLLMTVIVPVLAALFGLLYHQEMRALGEQAAVLAPSLRLTFLKAYAALLLVSGIVAWWLVLAHRSRVVAQEESNRQTEALMREIESHRRTDEALQQAKHQAELANQAKSRYITTISHELRTPLNSILGYAQLLDEDEAMPAHRKQAVRVIRRGGDHLLSLVEGTLDLARIEGGKLALEVKPMRFRDSMLEIARLFELQAAGKGIAFRHEFDAGVPEAVRADEKRVRQILINVLGNAVKFTTRGEVVFRLQYAREMARFEIEDSGPGMTAEEMARIFEPFERGSAAGGAAVGGTGLGLTIAKMLTDLMGGEMTVSSTPGVGTCFAIRLFLPELRATVIEAEMPRVPRTGYLGPRKRVLVVDNEEVDRGLLVSVLQPLGFEIHQAASGHECLAVLRQIQPDAIFMDLAMPGIDGWETLRRIRQEALSAAPAAIVSANAFDKGLDNDVGITPQDFLVKPVRVGELLDWLGTRLSLQWVSTPAPAREAAPPAPAREVLPEPDRLRGLAHQVALGYYRGIVRLLDEIEEDQPDCAAFVDRLRTLAREFQFDTMTRLIHDALDEPRPA
jgi:signal transduction histidine kinase